MLPGIPRLVSDGPSEIWPEDVVTNPTSGAEGLLSNIRVIESSLLGPGHVATFFADLGADVIKVSPRRRLHPADDLADHRGNLPAAPPHPSRQEEHHAQPQEPRRARRSTRNSSPPPTWSSRPKSPVHLPASDSATTCSRRSIPRSCSPPCRDTAPPAPTATCRATASPTTPGPASCNPSPTTTASPASPRTCRTSASTSARWSPRWASSPASSRPARPVSGARWSSPSRMLPPTWTGIASRPSGRTCARRTRSPATRPTITSGARRPGRHVGGRALSDVRGQ